MSGESCSSNIPVPRSSQAETNLHRLQLHHVRLSQCITMELSIVNVNARCFFKGLKNKPQCLWAAL